MKFLKRGERKGKHCSFRLPNNNFKMVNIVLSDCEIKLWIAYTMPFLFTFKNREVFLPPPVLCLAGYSYGQRFTTITKIKITFNNMFFNLSVILGQGHGHTILLRHRCLNYLWMSYFLVDWLITGLMIISCGCSLLKPSSWRFSVCLTRGCQIVFARMSSSVR
jgi:hypothetical protein